MEGSAASAGAGTEGFERDCAGRLKGRILRDAQDGN
jgi:hypothetical protein